MFKIQTLNTISANGLNLFPQDTYTITTDSVDPDAIIVRSQNMHEMKVPSSVKVIGRAGAGVNNIPVADYTKIGVPVLNTPGANANAVRELVIAGMFLASRNICQAWHYVSQLKTAGAELDKQIEQDKKQFVGFELYGKKLGVIGLGSIGVKVANTAINLGMEVIGFDPTITVNRAWELSANVKQALSIDDLLKEADFITFHVPLNDETKNLIDARRFGIMKKDAVLLNFARDGIIDNKALLEALNEKKILAYVSDFPSVPLKDHPRVISLPHLGASTKEAEENCAVMIVKQVRDFLENGTIVNSVNFPTLEMPNNGNFRLSVVNANIPNMVAQISSTLASAKLNILSLLNKSRDDIAYTLIDVNNEINNDILKNISNIQGVVQVRRIK
ncbi:MAG: 3-phosphoglycerate dehydrogenase family protein [Gammaproteobacteria bacterium]|nr:3-phosphoglycerate dehydrogenase family protein [Gammaproteobacteria bacterium]